VNPVASAVRWGSYLPAWTSGGRRVAAPDEDAFTLAVTAAERVFEPSESDSAVGEIHLVGDFPAVVDWGFGAFLGHAVEVFRHPGGVASFRAALEAAARADSGSTLRIVLAAELPEREGSAPGTKGASIGAGSVALRIEGGDRAEASGRRVPDAPSVLDAARELWTSRSDPERVAWAGDWALTGDGGRPADLARILDASNPPLSAVSEGAYVPRPRYLENLPSRWRLIADACDRCGTRTFPSRGACSNCRSRDGLRPFALPRDGGIVVASTRIGKGGQPTEFDGQVAATGPYGVVLVELAPGVRATLQVADGGDSAVPIGARVSTRLRRLYPMEGEWRYGRKAVVLPTGTANG